MANPAPVSESKALSFETSSIHAGLKRTNEGVKDVPIYASTSFVFNDSAHGAAIFGMTAEAFCYSRIANPTTDVFEKRMAVLENGAASLATSSGQAAIFVAVSALASVGDNIVVASNVSDSTGHQFKDRLPPLGIIARFAESGYIDAVRNLIDEKTKAVFVESISSTDLRVANLEALAKVAHDSGVPLIVDNTLGAGGFLIRPLDHGADIVLESASEYLSISGSILAGIIVDSGRFDWKANSTRFPQFSEPSPGFHGLVVSEKFKNLAFIAYARIAVLRDIGPCINPFEAFQVIAGLETLSVRIERASANALKFATWLQDQNRVKRVQYPGLSSYLSHGKTPQYLALGGGGLLLLTLNGAPEVAETLLENFKLISIADTFGGTRTTAILGKPSTLYISMGLENIDDIIADFNQALLST